VFPVTKKEKYFSAITLIIMALVLIFYISTKTPEDDYLETEDISSFSEPSDSPNSISRPEPPELIKPEPPTLIKPEPPEAPTLVRPEPPSN
jgi:hypothetical protein